MAVQIFTGENSFIDVFSFGKSHEYIKMQLVKFAERHNRLQADDSATAIAFKELL